MKMRSLFTATMTTLVVFAVAEFSVFSAPAVAQKKGQAVKIDHGRVVGMKQMKTESAKASGAAVGGTIGLVTGRSSGKRRRRNAAVGAAVGAAAAPGSQVVMQYTVETLGGSMIAVVSDQMEIRMDDCVVVEQSGDKANIRRVSQAVCGPGSEELVEELHEEFLEEATECLQAKEELVAAETDAQVDRAMLKVSILCDD